MKKTGGQVLDDVYRLLKESGITGFVSGSLYKNSRPFDSQLEDIVVSFKTGLDGQFQDGAVTINIYVPDIDNGSGCKVINSARCTEIEVMANEAIKPFTSSEYLFSLGNMIQTFEEPEIKQHFVSVDLRFKRIIYKLKKQ